MHCPTCKEVTLVMAERHGIEIDYCPQCRGVWLDRGELDKIIERTTLREPSKDKEYDDHSYRHGKKKRGFLGELFD